MDEEWLDEGLRQFRWGLAWLRLEWVLRRIARNQEGTSPPAEAQVEQIRQAFLEPDWLPGVHKTLTALEQELRDRDWDDLPPDLPVNLAALLRKGLAPNGTARLEDLFDACVRQLRAQPDQSAPAPAPAGQVRRPAPARGPVRQSPELAAPPVLSSADHACFWLRQAGPLRRWLDLQPALQREVDSQRTLPVRALLDQFTKVKQALAVPPKKGGFISRLRGALLSPQGPPPELKQFLQELNAVEQNLPSPSSRWSDEQQRVLAWLKDEINLEPTWPPLLVAQLQRDFSELGDPRLNDVVEHAGSTDRSRGGSDDSPHSGRVTRRVRLAGLLIRQLDILEQTTALPPQAWNSLQGFLDRLLLGSGMALKLVREPSSEPSWVESKEKPGSAPCVEVTGLLLKQGRQIQVLRKARLIVPSKLVQSLVHLGSRLEAVENVLSELCRKTADNLGHHEAPAQWWESLGDEGKGDVWRLLQRAVGLADARREFKPPIDDLLQQFEGIGIALVEPTLARGATTRGPWFFQADSSAKTVTLAPQSWGRGLALRGPDRTLIGPAVWLRVPAALMQDRPLLRCLAENEHLKAALKVRVPDWPGWGQFERLWELVYTPATESDEKEMAQQAFLAFYDQADKQSGPAGDGFRELARRLYVCLTGPLEVRFTPALDPDTLKAKRLATPPDETRYRYRWAVDSARGGEVGEVVKVDRFGTATEPCEVALNPGPVKEEVRRWLALPAPVFSGLPSDPERTPDNPLHAWYREVQTLPWKSDRDSRVERFREQFRRWLYGPGLVWFDSLAHDLGRPGAADALAVAAAWWQALQAEPGPWCRCYPSTDVTSGGPPGWPAGVDISSAQQLRWEFSETVPLRQAIGEIVFAPRVELVKGTFSLGPRRRGEVLDAAVTLHDSIRTAFEKETELVDAVTALLTRVRNNVLAGLPTANPDQLALPILDWLVRNGEQSEVEPKARPLLALLRNWCAAVELTVLPLNWQPGERLPVEGEGVEHRVDFSSANKGSTYLRRFGLRGARRGLLRTAVVQTSAGSLPHGYNEILAGLQGLPGSRVADLVQTLQAWPSKALTEDLSYTAVQFWVDFWRELDESFQNAHRKAFDLLEMQLRDMLEREFGLLAFYPEWLKEHPPDWIDLTPGCSIETGKVRRVVRPGLHTPPPKKVLRLRAIVEGE